MSDPDGDEDSHVEDRLDGTIRLSDEDINELI
jgi:hypothetical protein